MEDHNTRIIVFGKAAAQTRAAAEEMAKNASQNVSFCGGLIADLKMTSNEALAWNGPRRLKSHVP